MSLRRNLRCAALLALIAGCLGVGSAQAVTKYWDGTALGTGIGTGWDATTSWSTDPVNPNVDPAAVPGASDIATFNISSVNSDQTVNLYANQSAQGLVFNSTGDLSSATQAAVTLQGGGASETLTLGTSGITGNSGAGEVSISSNAAGQAVPVLLAGSQSWISNGTGILAVGGTGATIAPATGGGPVTLTLDGTNTTISTNALTSPSHAGQSNVVFGQITNGAGGEVLSVVKNGPGTWVLNNNANTFTGGVTLNSGAIAIGRANNVGTSIGTGTLTLHGGELRTTGNFGNQGLTNKVDVTGDVTIMASRADSTVSATYYFAGPWVTSTTTTPGMGPVVTLAFPHDGVPRSFGFRRPTNDFSQFYGTLKPTQFPENGGGPLMSIFGETAAGADLSKAKIDLESSTGNPIGINNDQIFAFNVLSTSVSPIQVGELSGNGRLGSLQGTSSFTIQVGALNTNSTFSGSIVEHGAFGALSAAGESSAFNLKKVGTGSLTMSGDNSYVGDTTIANGTLVAGIDALVSKTNITMLSTGAMSITNNTFDNSLSGGAPHGLANGDRIFVESFLGGASDTNVAMNAQPFYVVNANSTSFQLSLTPGGSVQTFADEPFAGASVAMPTAFGAGITPIALGDGTGGAVKLLAGTATRPSVTIARQVTVAAGGGTPTFGSTVDGNSAFTGAISLGQNTTLTSASAGANALTVSGAISSTGAFGLTKAGTGKAILSGANTYTGDTSVTAGTLSLTTPYLADAADVYLTTGALLNLNFAGTDTIDSLFIGGAGQATGTWGGTGSGAAHISTLLSGSGLLLISTVGVGSLAGDYNNNGVVDAADYVLWRKNPSAYGGTPGGYDTWRANYGKPPGSGSGLEGSSNVPEPASFLLMAAAVVGTLASRWRR